MNEREQLVAQARSICWERYGQNTANFNDLQCLIRAAEWASQLRWVTTMATNTTPTSHAFAEHERRAGAFFDLAEEIAGESV